MKLSNQKNSMNKSKLFIIFHFKTCRTQDMKCKTSNISMIKVISFSLYFFSAINFKTDKRLWMIKVRLSHTHTRINKLTQQNFSQKVLIFTTSKLLTAEFLVFFRQTSDKLSLHLNIRAFHTSKIQSSKKLNCKFCSWVSFQNWDRAYNLMAWLLSRTERGFTSYLEIFKHINQLIGGEK